MDKNVRTLTKENPWSLMLPVSLENYFFFTLTDGIHSNILFKRL